MEVEVEVFGALPFLLRKLRMVCRVLRLSPRLRRKGEVPSIGDSRYDSA